MPVLILSKSFIIHMVLSLYAVIMLATTDVINDLTNFSNVH